MNKWNCVSGGFKDGKMRREEEDGEGVEISSHSLNLLTLRKISSYAYMNTFPSFALLRLTFYHLILPVTKIPSHIPRWTSYPLFLSFHDVSRGLFP